MGMEVNAPSKRLHVHALPLAMLVLALTITLSAGVNYSRQAGLNSELGLTRDLVEQLLHVKPGANGLASIGLDSAQNESAVGATLGSTGTAGQAAEFSFSLQNKP